MKKSINGVPSMPSDESLTTNLRMFVKINNPAAVKFSILNEFGVSTHFALTSDAYSDIDSIFYLYNYTT